MKLKKKWKIEIGVGESGLGPYIISPIVYQKTIFTIDNKSKIEARDSKTGKLIWTKILIEESEEKINVVGGLAAVKDVLIISTGLGNIYSLN